MSGLERRDTAVAGPPAGGGVVAIERAVRVVGLVRRTALKLAVAAALAGGVIAYALLRHGWPNGAGRQVLTVVALAAAAVPPVVLVAFWQVVRELAGLPERLRRLPLTGREHAAELGRAVGDARRRTGRRRYSHAPRVVWRLARLTASSRDTLTPYAGVLPLLSVPFLVLVTAAAAAATAEIAVALVVALVLLVS